jgi:nitrous oxide reductase accessory protein NosL
LATVYLEKETWYKGETVKRALIFIILAAGLLMAESIKVSRDDTCAVRHLKIYKYPAWVAKAETIKGKTAYFSSPKSMFEFYFQPDRWKEFGAATPDDITSLTVTDFKTLEAINARSAYYVYGSTETSPAGDDLPSFASLEDAKKFAEKYKGKRILRFSEIKNSLIRLINGRI